MRVLEWRHRGWFARTFDLMEDEKPIARLEFRGWGFGATLATSSGRDYTLAIRGLFRWSVVVRDDRGFDVATMRIGWRGQGEPTLVDGRRLRWDAENAWATRWALDDPERGARIARVHMGPILHLDARVEIEEGAPPDDVLLPLLALAWYSAVITNQAMMTAGAG